MRKIMIAALSLAALSTAALAEGGDNPVRDLYAAPKAPVARSMVDPAVTATIREERRAAPRQAIQDLREYQLWNSNR
ncbi:hypothetical protein [Salinarimonas soli]|uniref:Uncharacterized protein n=1 Tax=Salinarimonas soli TaxID=1638099 RepID=A0A5B2VZP4_9HYPH|nr:hypothetical protein [Salinarimonas soli]KAA2244304.1 hypothetical protein F0L46_00510 [Salinarimonas soli]